MLGHGAVTLGTAFKLITRLFKPVARGLRRATGPPKLPPPAWQAISIKIVQFLAWDKQSLSRDKESLRRDKNGLILVSRSQTLPHRALSLIALVAYTASDKALCGRVWLREISLIPG